MEANLHNRDDLYLKNIDDSYANFMHEAGIEDPVEYGRDLLKQVRLVGRFVADPLMREHYAQTARNIGDRLLTLTGEYLPVRLEPLDTRIDTQSVRESVSRTEIEHTTWSISPVPFMVPYAVSVCLGRDEELATLDRLLEAKGSVVALTGLGGVGKTLLAATYGHRFRTRFPEGVFWLHMGDMTGIAVQVAACGGPGGLALPGWEGADLADRVALVRAAWQRVSPFLLVFDDLEDPALLAEWRPTTGGCRVVITSRRAEWPAMSGVQVLPVSVLARAASRELLCRPWAVARGEPLERMLADAAVDSICALLGDLPLALALAAAYLATYPTLSLEAYHAKLRQAVEAEALLEERSLSGLVEGVLPTAHKTDVAGTIALSYEQLEAAQPVDALALRLLHRAACLASAPIPRALLLRTLGGDPAELAADGPEADALRRLSALGLLSAESDSTLRLHPLIAAYVRAHISDLAPDVAAVEEALIDEARRLNATGYPTALLPLHAHLRAATERAMARADVRAGALCDVLGDYLTLSGAYAEARPVVERALAIWEQALGSDHPDTAASLNNLAGLLQAQGDYSGARPLYERALAIWEQALGSDHPDTAASLNNLAGLLRAQGDYSAAMPLYERALAIDEAVYGDDHPNIATDLNNLAGLRRAQGDYAAARSLYEHALAIWEKTLGPTHPDTAQSLNNLAGVLLDQGDLAAAQPLLERALAVWEQALGPAHPTTASSLNNLANLLQAQGDLAAARPLLERALGIREEVLGPAHPDTASSLNNLASLSRAMGHSAAARPLFERALAINEQVLGPTHPTTATSLNNLASLLHDQGDFAAARPLYERALAIDEAAYGPEHPKVATDLNNLASLLHAMGDLAAARPLFERALAILEQMLGSEHPDIATSLNNLANLLHDQGDDATARLLLERVLAIWQQREDRAREAATFYNLGGVAAALGRSEEGARLLALCVLIEARIGHSDADADRATLLELVAGTDAPRAETAERRVEELLEEAVAAYANDRGWDWVRVAFPGA